MRPLPPGSLPNSSAWAESNYEEKLQLARPLCGACGQPGLESFTLPCPKHALNPILIPKLCWALGVWRCTNTICIPKEQTVHGESISGTGSLLKVVLCAHKWWHALHMKVIFQCKWSFQATQFFLWKAFFPPLIFRLRVRCIRVKIWEIMCYISSAIRSEMK